jgi:uncharacterized damage-inducible protein DinB
MRLADTLLPEFDQEMKTTRRLMERVPSDKGSWKPHPKSFSLGHLAQLVAWMPAWIANAINETKLDLTKYPGYSLETTEWLLNELDKNVQSGRKAIEGAKESEWDVTWSLTRGDMVLFSAPRRTIVRQHINHLVHHRGQLSVYLRLNDVPLPPMYGPTADERV